MFSPPAAEFLGTFWLVLGGCGSAVLAAGLLTAGFLIADVTHLGISFLGVPLGAFLTDRIEAKAIAPYLLTQVVAGIVTALVLFVVASGQSVPAIVPTPAGSFATNGYGEFSPGGYSLLSALVLEIVLTAVFDPAALGQVWLFIVAPLIGAAIAGLSYRALFAAKR